jgi:phosphoglucosamine mutase
VLERLEDKGWLLGGENSGHVLCLDKHTTGDAIIAALAVLRALVEQRTTLARAADGSRSFPQRLINVRSEGLRLEGERAIRDAQAGTVAALGETGPCPAAPLGHGARAPRDGRSA